MAHTPSRDDFTIEVMSPSGQIYLGFGIDHSDHGGHEMAIRNIFRRSFDALLGETRSVFFLFVFVEGTAVKVQPPPLSRL